MVAEKCASDKRFPTAYKAYFDTLDTTERKKIQKTLETLINAGAIHVKIADFLFMSDTKGYITYKGCSEILRHLKDVKSDEVFGYAAWENPFCFNDFVTLLSESVENKCKLVWE